MGITIANRKITAISVQIQIVAILRYKWEAYCDRNGRSTESVSFLRAQGHRKHCDTNKKDIWRIAILFEK